MTETKKHTESSLQATSGPWVNFLLMIWLVGAILGGKPFTYLKIGPIFITEFVLGALLLSNIKNLRTGDILFFSSVVLFFVGGIIAHGSIFFAGKDLSFMYYLLFLRFFPRSFPEKYSRYVLAACILISLLPFVQLLGLLKFLETDKYRFAPICFFLLLNGAVENKGRVKPMLAFYLLLVALAVDFKTLILLMLVVPFLLSYSKNLMSLLKPKYIYATGAVLGCFILLDGSQFLMNGALGTLNLFSDLFLAGSQHWTQGTAQWRSSIWTRALTGLFSNNSWVLGELPGHNFMNWRILGDPSLTGLTGENSLGIVRSAHNILVQILMKTGIVGFIIYAYYYWKWMPKDRTIAVYHLVILICALTSDILEVPSRGPLFFSLSWILMFKERARPDGYKSLSKGVIKSSHE